MAQSNGNLRFWIGIIGLVVLMALKLGFHESARLQPANRPPPGTITRYGVIFRACFMTAPSMTVMALCACWRWLATR